MKTVEKLENRRFLNADPIIVAAADAVITEGEVIELEITRTGDLSEALTLEIEFGGTATPGQDTMIPDGTVSFEPGESTTIYSLASLADDVIEGDGEGEEIIARVSERVTAETLVQKGEAKVEIEDLVHDPDDDDPGMGSLVNPGPGAGEVADDEGTTIGDVNINVNVLTPATIGTSETGKPGETFITGGTVNVTIGQDPDGTWGVTGNTGGFDVLTQIFDRDAIREGIADAKVLIRPMSPTPM
ncbi:MAG: hypothetical protein AAGD32_06385 [Planctomycetota bacterium]